MLLAALLAHLPLVEGQQCKMSAVSVFLSDKGRPTFCFIYVLPSNREQKCKQVVMSVS